MSRLKRKKIIRITKFAHRRLTADLIVNQMLNLLKRTMFYPGFKAEPLEKQLAYPTTTPFRSSSHTIFKIKNALRLFIREKLILEEKKIPLLCCFLKCLQSPKIPSQLLLGSLIGTFRVCNHHSYQK
jgi:hypothetical protein